MPDVLVFAERMLPSTQTFIPLQVDELKRYTPHYVGLIPAERNYSFNAAPILLAGDRSPRSRMRRELYRWTGIAPFFHSTLRRAGAEILHAHFAEGGPPALFLSKTLNIPLVLHLRGGAEMLADEALRQHLFQRPFLAYRRQLWQRASLFFCVSKFIREKALKAGFPEEKLRVHYTGMHCEAFTPKLPLSEKDSNLILYVGRLIPYKGCDYLIQAVHRIQQERPAARLVVIGEGTFQPELKALSNALHVQATFLGEQSQQAIRWWLERARVFCGPSVTLKDGMSEAFGNVFSEAQSMGVPVVSFDHGGIPETMRDGVTGLLAPERDVETLATHLQRFLADDTFWSRARTEGMSWVRENFSVQDQTAKLEQIYDNVRQQFRPENFSQAAPAE